MNGVPVAARATAYLTGRKRTREGYWFLLRVQIGRRRSAASTATLTGDGDGAGLANRGDAATFRRLDPANRLEVVLRQCTKGQEGRNFNGGVKSNRRRSSPALVSERNSRRGVTRSRANELEDAPEVEAEPVRSLDGAQVRRGGRTPAAHGALRGGARWLRRG